MIFCHDQSALCFPASSLHFVMMIQQSGGCSSLPPFLEPPSKFFRFFPSYRVVQAPSAFGRGIIDYSIKSRRFHPGQVQASTKIQQTLFSLSDPCDKLGTTIAVFRGTTGQHVRARQKRIVPSRHPAPWGKDSSAFSEGALKAGQNGNCQRTND